MICPRCKCEIPDDSKVCEICGKKLEKKSLFEKRKEKKPKVKKQISTEEKRAALAIKLKITTAAVVTVGLVIAIIMIISAVGNSSGANTAKKLAEYMNEPILAARNQVDVYLADESSYDGLNNLARFNYLVEAEKDVDVDGVSYPRWAVLIRLNDIDQIADVTYVDFKVLKKNRKGPKTDEEINLDKIPAGEKYRKVASVIDIEPFSIAYKSGTVTYTYKYYFVNNFKDEQAMTLSVVFDSENCYMYSTSQRENENWLL